MAEKAIFSLPYVFACLLLLKGHNPGIDLMLRYNEVQLWFSGGNVYSYSQLPKGGVYPPASHVILWPFLTYSSWVFVRCLWVITSLAGLVGLVYLLVGASKAYDFKEKAFVGLMILATNATHINILKGQLTIHTLAFLVSGLVLIGEYSQKQQNRWQLSLLAGFLIAVALVKPTITVPFLLIPMFVPQGRLIAIITVIIYTLLALLATAFQDSNIVMLHLEWLERGTIGAVLGSKDSAGMMGGYGDIHSFLDSVGMSEFNFESSILILAIFAVWLYFHRFVDLWLLIGIASLVSRFWAYHRMYDDILIILPMVTLFRLTKQTTLDRTSRTLSGILLGIATFSILFFDRLLFLNSPGIALFVSGQVTIWILMLGFLVFQAFVQRNKIIQL
ncbi:glycosyltransferase family 87 protein [Hyella patelloides]|nr:glycosyltransferase family 87 protein [Hyella patelloides]